MAVSSRSTTGNLVAPATRDLDELAVQLAEWIGTKLADATGIRVFDLTYPQGAGQSAETILFSASWTQSGEKVERGLVVRLKPLSFTVFHYDMFLEQYELMRALHRGGVVPIADTFWLELDETILGGPFFVMERLRGRVPVSIPSFMQEGWVTELTATERDTLWRNGVRALATVAAVPIEELGFLPAETGKSGFELEWDRWVAFRHSLSRPDRPLPFHQAVEARLLATRPAAAHPGLVWGDARIGNVMIGDDLDVVALMDWEQPSLGGALNDIGWWLFDFRYKTYNNGGVRLDGFGSRDEMIALWHQETGIPVDDIDWYEAFAAYKFACLHVRLFDLRGDAEPGDHFESVFIARLLVEMLDLDEFRV